MGTALRERRGVGVCVRVAVRDPAVLQLDSVWWPDAGCLLLSGVAVEDDEEGQDAYVLQVSACVTCASRRHSRCPEGSCSL